ncbi:hypothetical protein BO71DRAFT_451750 [Aspergillus ellipticus CBS 707.79]|uniref:TAM domain methyltransferase n=1 Tax=Aspergillus ellipticus CBS 707.79 TaxID=1448320 RepID=A0A319D4D8_9EURO|nr:hypothetical protein BO71DRAFT_451750 [Aspergillus ellipticus CBS 707.79]
MPGGRLAGSSREDDTQSLTASVIDYPMEHGRRYHKYHEGSYLYPNDEQELDRMDMQHHMLKIVNTGRLFLAPVQHPRRILDIGTGSGIWPIELASQFPAAEIIGTDLSPVQPNEVPENVHFLVDDATEDDWLWGSDHFDFIHVGHLSGALPSYKDLLRKVFKHLKPGGYVESHEFDPKPKCDDGTLPPEDDEKFSDYALQDLMDLHVRSGQVSDPPRQFRVAHRLARWMREVGFEDVQEHVSPVPINPWSTDPHLRTVGAWNETNMLEAVAGWSYKPLTILGWSKPEIEVFLVDVRKSIQNRDVHAYMNYHVVTGRKPHAAEDFLASAFRRFANGQQRRYESRVPGPLEARKRLSKRRNTALAGVWATGPPDDFGGLFGRNGREHLKKTDSRGSRKAWPKTTGWQFRDIVPPPPPTGQFFDLAPAPPPTGQFFDIASPPTPLPLYTGGDLWQEEYVKQPPGRAEALQGVPYYQYVKDRLSECRTVESVKSVVRELDFKFLEDRSYSRFTFKHLLMCSDRGELAVEELILFLDDPRLNVQRARNYQLAMKHVGTDFAKYRPLFYNFVQALELGLIPPKELINVIKTITNWAPGDNENRMTLRSRVTSVYKNMWDAIGRCDVYGHGDLDHRVVDLWLGDISRREMHEELALAKRILLATRKRNVSYRSWATLFITRWLELPETLRVATGEDYASGILNRVKPDVATAMIVSVTESLVSSRKFHLLEQWQCCLSKIQDIPGLAMCRRWHKVYPTQSAITSQDDALSRQHKFVIRFWILLTLSRSLPVGPFWLRRLRATDKPIFLVLLCYQASLLHDPDFHFLSSLANDIQDLGMPYNELLITAVDLMSKNIPPKSTRQALVRLERSELSVWDLFADTGTYNATKPHFFIVFEKMVRNIDVTSPEFIGHALNLARTGDSHSVWALIRLLRIHTPLKIALSQSWGPVPDVSEKALGHYPEARTSHCPDPHATLEMIHDLAVSLACSRSLTPRRAFSLIRWLYHFLVEHCAPVQPPLVRAMYHAGVVRFRREGYRVSPVQYAYIMRTVKTHEGPEVVAALMESGPRNCEALHDM